MTVKELFYECKNQINKGNGDKEILISCDDKGNGFHTLFYSFNDDINDLNEYASFGMFHDNNDPETIVVLG